MEAQTLNISMPKALIKEMDDLVRSQSYSRSEFIRSSVRAQIRRMRTWGEIFAYGEKKAKELGLRTEEDIYHFLER